MNTQGEKQTPPSGSPALPASPRAEDPELARTEWSALQWTALASVVLISFIALPVGTGILLGLLMAFTLEPLFEKLAERTRHRRMAAVLTTLLALFGTLITAGGFGTLLIMRGAALARQLVTSASPGGALANFANGLSPRLSYFGLSGAGLLRRLEAGAAEIAGRVAKLAELVAAQTASGFLALFFASLTMHTVLRNWDQILVFAQRSLPLKPHYTRMLFEEFRRTGRVTLFGTIATALVQGGLATLGYLIAGVPESFFFGTATALASLVPAVGTLLVWVPIGIVLIATGHTGRGILELAWGALVVVGLSDYFVRPRLIGREEHMPTLVTFIALFGGIEAMGLKGLVLGPVAMSLGIAALRLYACEMRERRVRTLEREQTRL